MCKSSKGVLESIPLERYKDKGITKKETIDLGVPLTEIFYYYEMAGYGPNKAIKRIKEAILSHTIQEVDKGLWTCIWWPNTPAKRTEYTPIIERMAPDYHGVIFEELKGLSFEDLRSQRT